MRSGVVVVATYNEAANIGAVVVDVATAAAVLRAEGIALRLLLVDDRSPDGTAAIATDTAAANGLAVDVESGGKAGLGAALLRGLERALQLDPPVEFIVTLDGDGQHDATQIPQLVRGFDQQQSGVMIGSRWAPGGRSPGTSPARKVLSRSGNKLFRVVTGTRGVRDATTSFRVIRAEVAQLFDPSALSVKGYAFFSAFVAVAQAHGYSVHETPIEFRPRNGGQSKLRLRDGVEFLTNQRKVRAMVQGIRAETNIANPRFRGQDGLSRADFGAAAELEHLGAAHRFIGWILSQFGDALRGDVLEVGAGIGAVTNRLVERAGVIRVTALEPAANLFPLLAHNMVAGSPVMALQCTSSELLADAGCSRFDSAVYVNVLEHIEDDVAELKVAGELLREGGKLCVFVPANPRLYGTLDYKSGHHRRYVREGLARVVTDAGFSIDRIVYLDVASMIPYWLAYKVVGITKLSGGQSSLFDKVLVPLSQAAQRIVPNPPTGKNLLVVATRTSSVSPL
jgi:dolichol-phosphate mannosyltransferase